MIDPLISIITPTLNCENNIEACLRSVSNQIYKNIEHIVIDGCSSDATISIVKEYQIRHKNVKFTSEKDDGIYDAMNKGIKVARGEWLYFLGSDDRLCPDILNRLFSFDLDNISFVYGNVKRLPSNIIYDGEFNLKKLFYKNICHQSIFIRRSLFDIIGFYKIDYKTRADYAFNIQVFSRGIRTKYIPVTVAEFSDNGICSRYFDIDFWKNYKENYIKPFKKVISRKERYSILWKYFYHLLYTDGDLFEAITVFIVITLNELNLRHSLKAARQMFTH